MLKGTDYKPGDAIYTFVDKEGNNTHVDSEKLRLWCAEHHGSLLRQCSYTPVDPRIAVTFVEENVIWLPHAEEVMKMPKWDPIIYGKWGTETNGNPDVILIDGHHRFFCAFLRRMELIPAYILELHQWKPFQIDGLPNWTEDQLRALPTKHQWQKRQQT